MTRSQKLTIKALVNCVILGVCIWLFAIVLNFCITCITYGFDLYRAEYYRQHGFTETNEKQNILEEKAEEDDMYKWCYDSRQTEVAANIRNLVIILAGFSEIILIIIKAYLLNELVKFARKRVIKLFRRIRKIIYSKIKLIRKKEELESQILRFPSI